MKLNIVSACGEYLDEEKTKMKIEDGFDFDITVSESQAKDMGVGFAVGDSHLCFRISSTGAIDGVICECFNSDSDVVEADAISEEKLNIVEAIVTHFRLREMAEAETRAKLLNIISDVSLMQPKDAVMVGYGGSYDKYLQAYSTCLLAIYKNGKRMIEKEFLIDFDPETESVWKICLTNDDADIETAKQLRKEYNIRDEYVLDFLPDEIEKKLYAISPEGVKEGQAEVRRMSGRAASTIYYKMLSNRDKRMPDNLIHKICKNLLRGSGGDPS